MRQGRISRSCESTCLINLVFNTEVLGGKETIKICFSRKNQTRCHGPHRRMKTIISSDENDKKFSFFERNLREE